jgi:hypothetical protein
MKPCLANCQIAVKVCFLDTIFALAIRFIHWMRPQLIFACLFFPGRIFEQPGAVKLHVGLNHSGYFPEFLTVAEGKKHDVTVGRTLKFPKGSIVVVDKGYNDYTSMGCRGLIPILR